MYLMINEDQFSEMLFILKIEVVISNLLDIGYLFFPFFFFLQIFIL